ncbi:ocs element-binding factor 1-like [Panicum virgatum]|uniref:BZIP domain-containing protein n=1 Tax=Panicum virgatum TaxID=38727 RepID=A0A8T0MI66_PANVG|nr:ocs element-binding factor 1-like [Panicum virgatum]KAG2534929.1 hypothetical protein PVAP13_9NG074900 [Panicum virgatum]
MLSVQEALDLDFAAASSSCGARDMGMDIITCGFTPWGPDSCPSLDQVMASRTAPPAREEEDEEEERRQRRKESNRLSARRSRERKQQRLEELRGTAARLRAEKQALEERQRALARNGVAVCRQNARLRAEAAALARRLREARRLLALRRIVAGHALSPAMMMPPPLQHQQAAGVAPLGLASLMT